MTSDPFGRFKILRAIVKASVPLAQPIAYLTPQKLANSASKKSTFLPNI